MSFALSPEQRQIVATIRRFIETELAPLEQQVEDEGRLDEACAKSIFEKSKALGLYGLNVPQQYGGPGLSHVDRMLCEEQFGRTTDILIRRAFGNVYEPLFECVGEQRERWLLPTVRGERVGSIALTEPGAGSDAAGIRTHAQRAGEGWILNGAKHFISDGLVSDYFLVSAKTGEREISMFIVDKGLPGFTIGRDQKMMGLRGTSHVELFFDNVPLDELALLGERGQGFKLAMRALNIVRLAQVAARAVGKATLVLEKMLAYAKERTQFGQAIGQFQMIQQMLADSATEIHAARLMVRDAAAKLDAGLEAREEIAMVKVFAAEMLGRVVDRAVQVFGGMGYCKDLPIERYYRDARIYRIFDGTSEIHRGALAKALLRKGIAVADPAA